MLVEVYRTPDDPARHKETAHYQTWREAVEALLAEPRTGLKYSNVFPDEAGWGNSQWRNKDGRLHCFGTD